MNQCLKIILTMDIPQDFLHAFIQKYAKDYKLEGTVQAREQHVTIVVCGSKKSLDDFVDIIHQCTQKNNIENIEMEPFFKEKDYRGVFRVIE